MTPSRPGNRLNPSVFVVEAQANQDVAYSRFPALGTDRAFCLKVLIGSIASLVMCHVIALF